MISKLCSKCDIEKSIENFHKRAAIKSGYRSECKSCGCDRRRKYHKNNREVSIEASNKWKRENKNKVKDYSKRYSVENKDKIKLYRSSNLDKSRRTCAKRRAAKLKATPNWGELNSFIIEEAYSLAKIRKKLSNFQWHVDHIVPLKPRSRKVCGLHVGINLQVIPWKDNLLKSDKI